jgi:hypothetical protein
MRALFRWITTPPQAYVVYFVLIVAVGGLSFLAGTLKPKKTFGLPPQSVSEPRH